MGRPEIRGWQTSARRDYAATATGKRSVLGRLLGAIGLPGR
jgi:hypothetical protein